MAAQPETLSVRRLNRATLARQLLLEREDVRVADAVRRLGGLQAQEPRPPFVALTDQEAAELESVFQSYPFSV